MAVSLEFINIIIPIANIERCVALGGFEGLLQREGNCIGSTDWYDAHLYRTGAMNPLDLGSIIQDWQGMGLTPFKEVLGQRKWNDLCVIDSLTGLTLSCDWIEFDLQKQCAWLRGTTPGEIVGRADGTTYDGVVLS